MKVKSLLKITASTKIELVSYEKHETWDIDYIRKIEEVGDFYGDKITIHWLSSDLNVPQRVMGAEILRVSTDSATDALVISYKEA